MKTTTNITLNKSASQPLYLQLSNALAAEIHALPQGEKLPTIRSLSSKLGITNNTVVNAYKHLETKGLIYTITGSGVYVAQTHEPQQRFNQKTAFNFASATTDPALFPTTAFRQSCDQILFTHGAEAFSPPLLQEKHAITNITQILEHLAVTLLSPGDTVITETPSPQTIYATLKQKGIRIIEFPVTEPEALSFLLKKHSPKLVILTPNFQTPTSLCYTTLNKCQILSAAAETNTYILEIDTQNDFYYTLAPPKTLHDLDTNDCVIYLKTYTKILTPRLDIGYLTCPAALAQVVQNLPQPPGFIQRLFHSYIQKNFAEHTANLRSHYKKCYKKLIQACETYLSPYATFTKPNGGLGIWVTPNKWNEEYYAQLLNRQVVVSPGHLFTNSNNLKHFHLSFANIPESRIPEGIGIIASILRET